MNIRSMTPLDWDAVKDIYQKGISTGNATFQTSSPEWEEWNKSHLSNCRLVAEIDNKIVGWAGLSPVSSRCVYAGVAEVSVYVNPNFNGMGLGFTLLKTLVLASETEGIWTLQSGIFPENIGSIRIHEKAGFRKVGYREKIGKQNGIWRDTVLMERRSEIIIS